MVTRENFVSASFEHIDPKVLSSNLDNLNKFDDEDTESFGIEHTMAQEPIMTYHYFDIYGRAEPGRIMMTMGNF